jgi:hypothetical protein
MRIAKFVALFSLVLATGAALAASPDTLYRTWQTNNRSDHEKAAKAAQAYLHDDPSGAHAKELQAWLTAYARALASLGLAPVSTPETSPRTKSRERREMPSSRPTRDLSGMYSGPLTLQQNTRLSGMVTGDVTVPRNVDLELSGMVAGSVHVQPGGRARISGVVSNSVMNDGGHVEIYGRVGNVQDSGGAKTLIDPQASVGSR